MLLGVRLGEGVLEPGRGHGQDVRAHALRDLVVLARHGLEEIGILDLGRQHAGVVGGHDPGVVVSEAHRQQRGPRIQGWRNTATNQNLNRDYLKLDQPEMRAVRGLILKYQPDLYVDVHVTDGMDYQYDVTYGFNGENGTFSRSPASSRWARAWPPTRSRPTTPTVSSGW